MNDKVTIREAQETESALIQELVKEMASYERRPEDMIGTQEQLHYWLFERKIATILLIEYEGKTIGYAIYYPIFGSFAARANIHLEDLGGRCIACESRRVRVDGMALSGLEHAVNRFL